MTASCPSLSISIETGAFLRKVEFLDFIQDGSIAVDSETPITPEATVQPLQRRAGEWQVKDPQFAGAVIGARSRRRRIVGAIPF